MAATKSEVTVSQRDVPMLEAGPGLRPRGVPGMRIGDRGAVNTRERRELVRPVITQREDFNDRNAAHAERIRYE